MIKFCIISSLISVIPEEGVIMIISNYELNGHNIQFCDTEICKNIDDEIFRKDIAILHTHSYRISYACRKKCDECDGTDIYTKNDYLCGIESITYGIDNKDMFLFKIVLLSRAERAGEKWIEVVHVMEAEIYVNRDDASILCSITIAK